MLNLVFLKYVTVDELSKVLQEFTGENATMYSYAPANLLFILDSRRNMRRTMELIALFDSDTFANQRVRLFEVKNARPSNLVKDLENILKSISLNDKTSPVRFLPVDRINTLIAIAPNAGVFDTVEEWLRKLDIPVKITAGAVETYVYRVKYGRSDCLALALGQLFGGYGSGTVMDTAAATAGAPGGGYPVPTTGAGGYNGYGAGAFGGAGYGGGYNGGGYGGGLWRRLWRRRVREQWDEHRWQRRRLRGGEQLQRQFWRKRRLRQRHGHGFGHGRVWRRFSIRLSGVRWIRGPGAAPECYWTDAGGGRASERRSGRCQRSRSCRRRRIPAAFPSAAHRAESVG